MVNWSDWTGNFINKSMFPYEHVMGIGAWAFIFSVVIVYVYVKQQSFTTAAIAGLIILAVFVNFMGGLSSWVNLMYVSIALIIAVVFTILFIRRRG